MVAAWGLLDLCGRGVRLARDLWTRYEFGFDRHGLPVRPVRHASWTVRPGPPRGEPMDFQLNEENALRLHGIDDPHHERWADVAGNYYSRDFIRRFTYADVGAETPAVYVRYDREAPTFRGRLEARGLKPNFAYQIKLLGDPAHMEAFNRLGYTGRWRLPLGGTNYTDQEYADFPDKSQVEAYLFFDFFVTDADGNAVREFSQDHSLHVLWNASRQYNEAAFESHLVPAVVDASSPATYVHPRRDTVTEYIYSEREHERYDGEHPIYLPAGDYSCFLILTEESFHSTDNNGGSWATVYKSSVTFTVTTPPAIPPPKKEPPLPGSSPALPPSF
jgi:hypothetical protein